MTRLRLVTGTCLAALALAAAGCGGGDDSGSSGSSFNPQNYATRVCSIAAAWSSASKTIDQTLAGSATTATALQAIADAQGPTNVAVDDIRNLPEPEDEAGKEAYASLQTTADDLATASAAVQTDVNDFAAGTTDEAAAAKSIDGQISSINTALRDSVRHLDAIYPEDNVIEIVRSDQNCRALGV